MVVELPKGITRSMTNKLLNKKLIIAEMEHKDTEDLGDKKIVYRLALSGKKEKGKEEEKITAFVVKGYESCILVQLGKTVGVLPEGIYEIDKNFQFTGTEIIWIDSTEFRTKWGIADCYLRDNINIAAHGSLLVKVSDPKKFVLNVVSGKKVVDRAQVDKFILNLVVQTYKDVLGEFSIDDVLRNRETIKQNVQVKLYDLLNHWGLSLVNLEIEGIKLPKKFEKLGEMALENRLQDEKEVREKKSLKKKLEADKLITEIELEKEKSELQKSIKLMEEKQELMKKEIEMMRIQRELELEKMKMEEMDKDFKREQKVKDAQIEFEKAKLDTEIHHERGKVDVDLKEKQELAKVAGEVKLIQANTGGDSKIIEIEANRDVKIAQAKAGVNIKKDKEESKLNEKREKDKKRIDSEIKNLKEQLYKFDDLFANGKISEDIYKVRVNRIEKELKELESQI